jgi:hypothetical protein
MKMSEAGVEGRTQRLLADYFSEERFADEIGYTVRAVRSWRSQRRGPPFIKIGKAVYYKITAVEAWLKTLERPTRSSLRAAMTAPTP